MTATIETEKKSTRDQILNSCLLAISKHGFNALRTDNEIRDLGITKGAFYHYFASKTELGVAVFKERIEPFYAKLWHGVINNSQNIKEEYYQLLENEKRRLSTEKQVGDVLTILINESSLLEPELKKCILTFVETLLGQIQSSLKMAKAHGKISPQGDSKSQSMLLLNLTLSCYILPTIKNSHENFASNCNNVYKLLCDTFFTDQGAALPFA